MACTINNVTVVGNWLLNNTQGIRGFPYDANFPDDFGNIGTGRYGHRSGHGHTISANSGAPL